MGCNNHLTVDVSDQIDDDAPVLNGVRLTDAAAVREAFDYLGQSYNKGAVCYEQVDERVIIMSRSGHCEHFNVLMDAHDAGYVRLANVYVRDGQQVVEVVNA